MADPDWSDPCAVLSWLRPQYYRVVAGLQKVTIRHGDDSVTYGEANKDSLATVFRQLESECAKQQGAPTGRRRAFLAG